MKKTYLLDLDLLVPIRYWVRRRLQIKAASLEEAKSLAASLTPEKLKALASDSDNGFVDEETVDSLELADAVISAAERCDCIDVDLLGVECDQEE